MEGWRAKTISQAGRGVLIKAVATTVPSYAMSTFLLPKTFCRKLDQCFKNFWWGFSPKKSKNLSLKSWNSLCSPKALGGLGFKKMEDVNLALITKLGWKLLTSSTSMWVQQLQGKYIFSGSFLSPPPPLPILLPHGYGKASSLLCLSFPKELAIESMLTPPFQFGIPPGFPPFLAYFLPLFFPGHSIPPIW
jgi:hypothetical protein